MAFDSDFGDFFGPKKLLTLEKKPEAFEDFFSSKSSEIIEFSEIPGSPRITRFDEFILLRKKTT